MSEELNSLPRDYARTKRVLLFLILFIVSAAYISVLFVQRSFIFDDSFISYRILQKSGLGLRSDWNRNEQRGRRLYQFSACCRAGTLHRSGTRSLWVTRLLSVAASLGICLLLVRFARRYHNAEFDHRMVRRAGFPAARPNVLSGHRRAGNGDLYLLLFLAFYFACRLLETLLFVKRHCLEPRNSLRSCCARKALMLAVLVVLVFAVAYREQKRSVGRTLLTIP
jgi:hypothetical protein